MHIVFSKELHVQRSSFKSKQNCWYLLKSPFHEYLYEKKFKIWRKVKSTAFHRKIPKHSKSTVKSTFFCYWRKETWTTQHHNFKSNPKIYIQFICRNMNPVRYSFWIDCDGKSWCATLCLNFVWQQAGERIYL